MNLSKMSIEKLRELDGQISLEIARGESRRKAEAIEQIQQIAASVGVPLIELLTTPTKNERKTNGGRKTQAYRDPTNPLNVWRGKGPQPAWMRAALAAGVSIDRLRFE